MIIVKELCVGYGKRKQIISSANAEIKRGKFTSILGANGSGKTTFLSAIAGALPISHGDVILDRISITNYTRKQLAQKLSFLPQFHSPQPISVRMLLECARFPYTGISRSLSPNDNAAIENAITLTAIGSFVNRRLTELSGGERQRVYFAMALAQGTPIILLDEPAAHLDAAQSFDLFRLILSAREQGKTIVAVTHDIAGALNYSDDVIFLEDGKLVFQGTPTDAVESGIAQRVLNVNISRSDSGYMLSPKDDILTNRQTEISESEK